MMTESTIKELRRIMIDNHRCFGCGHEHSCGTRGCAIMRNAADTLEAQQARIAQLEAKLKEERRWIPVEEGPPKKDGRYLCRYRFGEGSRMTFTHVLDYYATDPVPHFQHTLGDTTMRVTHWKPLPEWPEEV